MFQKTLGRLNVGASRAIIKEWVERSEFRYWRAALEAINASPKVSLKARLVESVSKK